MRVRLPGSPECVELRRSDPEQPGVRRVRCGRGFRYLLPGGAPLTDEAELARIKQLVIPPAWKQVWICTDPCGHLQAVGTDAAGRRQYLYHPEWRAQRDREKFDRMLAFAAALPKIRAEVDMRLDGRGYSRDRVLATAIRLLDLGLFRAGGEEYAEENGTFGLATLLRDQVHCSGGELRFVYLAKGSKERVQVIAEARVCPVIRGLKRRPGDDPGLLAYRTGRTWHDVRSTDINDFLREISTGEFTAKDFRTWHATVLAAIGLAVSRPAAEGSEAARKRAVSRVVAEVAGYLGNTPAVARASYIDPRVIDLYERGRTIDRALAELGAETEIGELASMDVEDAVRALLS